MPVFLPSTQSISALRYEGHEISITRMLVVRVDSIFDTHQRLDTSTLSIGIYISLFAWTNYSGLHCHLGVDDHSACLMNI